MPHPVIKLTELIRPSQILELPKLGKLDVLRRLSESTVGDPRVSDSEALYRALLARESQASTGIGLGLAIPHAKIAQIQDNLLVIARSREGLDFDALDGAPVHLVFMIGSSDKQTREFVRLLAAVTHVLKHDALRARLRAAALPDEFLALLREHELG